MRCAEGAADGDERVDCLGVNWSSRCPAKSDSDETAVAIDHYRNSHDQLERANRILIVGAGPTGLELAGEISDRWPDRTITILEPEPEILAGPYRRTSRQEVRRQLELRGVETVLGEALTTAPSTPPATLAPSSVSTTSGRAVDADIWFRCYGLAPVSDYLRGELAGARLPDGSINVTPQLQVTGHPNVFALGDVIDADLKTAGRAGRQTEIVAANIGALIDGASSTPTSRLRLRS